MRAGSVAAARRECDIPLAPPGDAGPFQKSASQILSIPLHHLHPNSRISLERIHIFPIPEGQVIRLFCGHLKVLASSPINLFEPPTVAKGITH